MNKVDRNSISTCSLVLSPAVLVPGFDLRVAQVQFRRELHAVLDAEVLLSLEALLERVELVVGERRPRLACLLRLARAAAARPGVMLQRLAA